MRLTLAFLLPLIAFCQGPVTPRTNPSEYPGHAEQGGLRLAGEILSANDVQNMFATDLSKYIVVEVAVYPKTGTQMEVSPIDFTLTSGGRSVRPISGSTIAGVLQRRGKARSKDILLYPTVGVTTGSWGTGTAVGLGVGMGNGAPGPASTDADRRTMESELEERELPDVVATKPVAGYLYFPAGERRRSSAYELKLENAGSTIVVSLPAKTP
ncbi:MAG TPA: hypothetical protein VEQ63_03860 [Bryobacteraceae bacterium]|nr:hypothetical protein [Bryobacteraceae bacterium]